MLLIIYYTTSLYFRELEYNHSHISSIFDTKETKTKHVNSTLKEKNIRKWNTILTYIIITTIWRTKVIIIIWAGIIENKFGNVKFLAWLLRWFPFVVWLSLLLLQSPEFVIVPMGRSFVSKFFMKWVIGICQSWMGRMEFKLDDERLIR